MHVRNEDGVEEKRLVRLLDEISNSQAAASNEVNGTKRHKHRNQTESRYLPIYL